MLSRVFSFRAGQGGGLAGWAGGAQRAQQPGQWFSVAFRV